MTLYQSAVHNGNQFHGEVAPVERPSDRSARVAEAIRRFAEINVSYQPASELIAAFDEVRLTALGIREARLDTSVKLPMPVIRTIAEMGVGKTTAAERFERMHRPADSDDSRRPVLIATLDTSGDQASVPAAILTALGKRGAKYGKSNVLWSRAFDALIEHEVEIVIFDEVNRAARRPTLGPVIGGDLADMLVIGQVGVAFLGTSEANKLFSRAPALRDRMKSPVLMKALDWDLEASDGSFPEREIFMKFLDRMDDALESRGLTEEKSGLGTPATAKLLWEVCRGRLRPLCLLLEEAVSIVHRNGPPLIIDHEVLADGVENHSIPNEVISYNPFSGESPE